MFWIYALILFFFSSTAFAQEKVVSLCPAITRMVKQLGCENQIISSYPEEKQLGSSGQPNMEYIFSLKPTKVLTIKEMTLPHYVLNMRVAGLNVIEFPKAENYSTIVSNFLKLSEMFGKKDEALKMLNKIQIPKENSGLKVFILLGVSPMVSLGNRSYINEIIRDAGAHNVFEDFSKDYFRVTPEEIFVKNPDIIFMVSMANEKTAEKEKIDFINRYSSLKAVKNNKVFILSQDIICSPTPMDYEEGVKQMREKIKIS